MASTVTERQRYARRGQVARHHKRALATYLDTRDPALAARAGGISLSTLYRLLASRAGKLYLDTLGRLADTEARAARLAAEEEADRI